MGKPYEPREWTIKAMELCDFFGVSKQMVGRWRAMGMPKLDSEYYDLKAVTQWRLDRIRANATGAATDKKKQEEEFKKLVASREIAEQKLASMRKETMSRADVSEVAQMQAREVKRFWTEGWRRNVDQVLKALGLPMTRAREVTEVFEDYIRQMMAGMIAKGKPIDDFLRDPGDSGTAV